MDGFASPSIRAGSPGSGLPRALETAFLTAAVGIALMGIPGVPDARLDASWQLMLIHAHAAGLQFGKDVIYTWGPWGFLCSGYDMGNVEAVPILIWQTAGQLGMALGMVVLTRGLVFWRRIAFAVLMIAWHWLFLDTIYFILIGLIVIAGLMRGEAKLVRLVGWTFVLGFLAQLKFTYFALASAGVLAAMACWAGRRSWAHVQAIAGGFAFAVCAAWCAAGQNLDNLYPYLRRSVDLASAYGDSMGLDESWTLFIWGAGFALLSALFIYTSWRALRERAFAAAACGYLAFSLFAIWKEAFTRADYAPLGGHVFGLFAYVLILAPVLPGLLFPGRRWHWFDASAIAVLAALASFDRPILDSCPRIVWERFRGNARALGRLGELPQEWQDWYQRACAGVQLPAVRAAVGTGTVDVYDFDTSIAFMNGLNLDSRPIFQGFTAYTPSLEGWNLRFYQSGRAPEFLLWNNDQVDNRYPGQDDAMLIAALVGHLEPLLEEGGYGLFRRSGPIPRKPPERRLLMSRTVRLSEEVVLPPAGDRAIWLRANAVPNNLGRLRSLVYKPAEIDLSTTDDSGRSNVWRLVPRIARDGLILVPTLRTPGDAAEMMKGRTRSWVRSLHFEAPDGQDEFWSHVDVDVFDMPDIPLRLANDETHPAESHR